MAAATLLELSRQRALAHGHRKAYTFRFEDGSEEALTYAEIDRRAQAVAAVLQKTAAPGERALLVYPASLDFVTGFLGCVYAGVIAVPATYPKPRRPMPRLSAIAADCGASVVLTSSKTLATLDVARAGAELAGVPWMATDTIAREAAEQWSPPSTSPDDLVFLQYTSGSTSEPKGVMVSHSNVLSNLGMIREGFGIGPEIAQDGSDVGVFWLPAYHDMGLVGGVLTALYVGGHAVLMSPTAFLQRPLRWLQAISDHGASVSGAPNFGYEICLQKIAPADVARLDLSRWRVAFCGAEPIRSDTLDRFAEAFAPSGFRPDTFYPCYGLAEATLLASGGAGPGRPTVYTVQRQALARQHVLEGNGTDGQAQQELVGCGGPLRGQEVVIADPKGGSRAAPDQVGEIWIKGPHVARGYWNRPEATRQTFAARLTDTGDGPYLRTGDLGFFAHGNLYVTGRREDLIVIRGSNHYPQDVERTAARSHPALPPAGGAAISIDQDGQQGLVIIHEVDRQRDRESLDKVIGAIRREVAEEHELEAQAIVLIRRASLPRTTSGKVQRALCRQRYLAGQLKVLAEWTRNVNLRPENRSDSTGNDELAPRGSETLGQSNAVPGATLSVPATTRPWKPNPIDFDPRKRPLDDQEIERLSEVIERWLVDWLIQRVGVSPDEVDREKPFAEYGIGSLTAVELSGVLEDSLDVELTPVVAWNHPTPASLARFLARLAGHPESIELAHESDTGREMSLAQIERMLSEVEALGDEEVEAALQDGGDSNRPRTTTGHRPSDPR